MNCVRVPRRQEELGWQIESYSTKSTSKGLLICKEGSGGSECAQLFEFHFKFPSNSDSPWRGKGVGSRKGFMMDVTSIVVRMRARFPVISQGV